MTRNPDGSSISPTLEDLLKQKAEQGVQVVLMPWGNDAEFAVVTYDDALAKAFKDTAVTVVRPGRRKGVCHALVRFSCVDVYAPSVSALDVQTHPSHPQSRTFLP